jgi:hypothetical protein
MVWWWLLCVYRGLRVFELWWLVVGQLSGMGHCIATLCKGGYVGDDAGDCETMDLLSATDPDAVSVGATKTKCVDTVVMQGFDGAHAMDEILRECLQYERGSRLHLCVAYRLLRIQIMKEAIAKTERVFLPDLMILYVGPAGVPGHCVQIREDEVGSITHAFMRVRVFRFIFTPTDLPLKTTKRKSESEYTNNEDET